MLCCSLLCFGCRDVKPSVPSDAVDASWANASPEHIYLPPAGRLTTPFLLNPNGEGLKSWCKSASSSTNTPFSGDDLAADFQALEFALMRMYPFHESRREAETARIHSLFQASIERFSKSGTISLGDALGDFLARWRFAFGDRHFQPIHVQALDREISRTGWQRKLLRLDLAPDQEVPSDISCRWEKDSIEARFPQIPQPWRTLGVTTSGELQSIWMLVAYSETAPQAIICGDHRYALLPISAEETAKKENPPADPPVYSFEIQGDTAWIRLRSFSARYDRELSRFVQDATRHRRHARLVLDLRGNGGGSNRYGYEWIKQLISHPIALGQVCQNVGADLAALQANQAIRQWVCACNANQNDTKRIQSLKEQAWSQMLRSVEMSSQPEAQCHPMELLGAAENDYKGQILVLVDRHTASSAENIVLALKHLENTWVIGEPTGGFIEAGELGFALLPRSGLAWGIPTKRFDFSGLPIRAEAVGLPVDVVLPDPTRERIQSLKRSLLSGNGTAR